MRASFRIKLRISTRRNLPHRANRRARLRSVYVYATLSFSLRLMASAWITFPFGETPCLTQRTYLRFQNQAEHRPTYSKRRCSCSCRCCSHWRNSCPRRDHATTSSHVQRLPIIPILRLLLRPADLPDDIRDAVKQSRDFSLNRPLLLLRLCGLDKSVIRLPHAFV